MSQSCRSRAIWHEFLLDPAGQRLGIVLVRAEQAQFAQHGHVDPRETLLEAFEFAAHQVQVVLLRTTRAAGPQLQNGSSGLPPHHGAPAPRNGQARRPGACRVVPDRRARWSQLAIPPDRGMNVRLSSMISGLEVKLDAVAVEHDRHTKPARHTTSAAIVACNGRPRSTSGRCHGLRRPVPRTRSSCRTAFQRISSGSP